MIEELTEQRAQLVAYLVSKTKAQDWHGVADAAMDLREIDAKMDLLRECTGLYQSLQPVDHATTVIHRLHSAVK